MNRLTSRSPSVDRSIVTDRTMAAVWLLLPVAAILVARDAWADILGIAMVDEEQSHIMLVPIFAPWMLWARRARFRWFRPHGTLIGPVLILAGWAASYIGYYQSFQAAWHGGAVLMLVGALVTGLGVNALVRFFPAFLVLAFIVPIPGAIRHSISGPLMTAAAYSTQAVLETFGVPVERSTNLLSLNGHDVTVAEACNGMRMVLALVLVSCTFAFSLPLRPYIRALVVATSPLAALVCNVIRLVPTVLLYGYAPEPIAKGWHDASGWLMLPVAFLLLLAVTSCLRWAMFPVTRFTLAYQ